MSNLDISTPLDLTYLYTISDDDREFVKDMIQTIVKNTPGNMAEIIAAREKDNWDEVCRLVHKLKPSLLLLNIESLSNHVRTFELNAKSRENQALADEQLAQLDEYCKVIVKELATEVANDTF